LRNASGAEFDALYSQQQMQAHLLAVDLFRNYAQADDDVQLKRWASATLPALRQHL
jgi:putative membrane protein